MKKTKATKDKEMKTKLRGGRRKCPRCKIVWNKPSGTLKAICPRCQTHCHRCDIKLTKENTVKVGNYRKQYICKLCLNERCKLAQAKRIDKNQAWRDANKERARDWALVNSYGITVVEYDKILDSQNGVCWICEKPPTGKRLAVDHLHSKGENKRNPREKRGRIRGLLCWHCNVAIGKFKDDITKLRRAADYLEAWPAQVVLKEKSNG